MMRMMMMMRPGAGAVLKALVTLVLLPAACVGLEALHTGSSTPHLLGVTAVILVAALLSLKVCWGRGCGTKTKTKAVVLGVGRATVPEKFQFKQEDLMAKFFENYPRIDEDLKQRATKLFEKVAVEQRAVIPPDHDREKLFRPVGKEYQQIVEVQGRPIFEEYVRTAAEDALEDWGGDRGLVTHLFYGSDTYFQQALPSIGTKLLRDLSLSNRTRVLNPTHMGCCGGFQVLSQAAAVAASEADARVLVIYGDLTGTQHSAHQAEIDEHDLLQFALFGDGCFAVLLGGSSCRAGERPLLAIQGWLCEVLENTAELLSHVNGRESVYTVVDRGLPKAVTTQVQRFLGSLVPLSILMNLPKCIFLVHPGGPAILQRIQGQLQLEEKQLLPSWTVLKEHGNMAGCTNLAVLYYYSKLRAQGQLPAYDWAIGLSFGPGITVQGVLFKVLT